MLFTNTGRMFRIKLNTIKTCGMNDKGTAVGSIVQLEPDEHILNIIPNTAPQDFILFTTEKGIIKKTKLKDYISNVQNLRGIKAVSIKDDDELLSVSLGYDTDSIILVTRHGYSIRFAADDINAQGKTAGGVKGITLNDSDYVASTILCNEEDPIFIFEDGGYGKIIANKAFQSQGRGGKGQKIRINSIVLHAMSVKTTDELYLVHSSNNVSPIKMSTIPFSTKNDISKSLSSKIVLDVYAL
jgi:DNA gyrase subunit A